MRLEVLIIDPQNDFCNPKGTLFVRGADSDMSRLAVMCRRLNPIIYDYHVTMDSHHRVSIWHPVFWIDSNGKHPEPGVTVISVEDVEQGKWRTYNPAFQARAYEYVKSLRKNNRYELRIWPYHCIIGTWGSNTYPELEEALAEWEISQHDIVDKITKGSNFWTEHYSAVQADVPDPRDLSTLLNSKLITTLEEADMIALAGEALQFCLKFTTLDIVNNFGVDSIKKITLLTDATSPVPVPGYQQVCDDFINDMVAKGMKLSTTVDFLK